MTNIVSDEWLRLWFGLLPSRYLVFRQRLFHHQGYFDVRSDESHSDRLLAPFVGAF
jgi:hypothetical protein